MCASMTSIASQTKLPPSPELKGLGIATNRFDDRDEKKCRLQSIARYESFHPQALACSLPLQDAAYQSSSSDTAIVPDPVGRFGRRSVPPAVDRLTTTSLAAVAGSDGVALFRISKPHVPLMILSHTVTNSNTAGAAGSVTSLAFSTVPSRSSLHLASARGTGVLVWDVSGKSLSPLLGRLSVEHSSDSSAITSLTWASGGTCLAASTATSACMWDLRQPVTNSFRPTLRFGVASNTGALTPTSYRQIACSDRNECAILDAAGTVRIFDTRMTDRATRLSLGNLCQFDACKHAGVGLSFLPLTGRNEHCWVTWGLDSPNGDAVVKVWMSGSVESTKAGGTTLTPDEYWFMDTSPDRHKSTKSSTLLKGSVGYRLVGKCTTRNLACARVCPAPVEDSIVTVGVHPKGSSAGWRADLWKLKFNKPFDDGEFEESKLERIVTFRGDDDFETSLPSAMGNDPRLRSLQASELGFSSYSGSLADTSDLGLMLCSLTENGYIMTHAIPEALPVDHHTRKDRRIDGAHILPTLYQATKLFPADSEFAINDAARAWGKPTGSSLTNSVHERNTAFERRDFQGNIIAGAAAGPVAEEGGIMPFEMDVHMAYHFSNAGAAGFANVGMIELISPATIISAIGSTEENDQAENDAREAAALMARIETDRMPCPRLCGATFSPGVGGLAAFHNGNVKRMWRWWERSDPARLAVIPGLIGEPSLHDGRNHDRSAYLGISSELHNLPKPSSNCPRTLKDLLAMTGAAKEAQWGEHDESDASSTGFPALGNNFFEDDDEGSSDSGDEQAEEVAEASKNQKRIHDNYFSGYQRSLIEPLANNRDSLDQTEAEVDADDVFSRTVEPASDMLSPLVKVSRDYDQLSLNYQSRDLATGWKLGDFNVLSRIKHKGFTEKQCSTQGVSVVDDAHNSPGVLSKRVLPSYRSLLPSSEGARNEVTHTSRYLEDERGVHGGEYSVRPNMQESMVFLRKLFTHQNHDGGKSSFPNFLSPPDSPMLLSKVKPRRKHILTTDTSSGGNHHHTRNDRGPEQLRIGVYTIRADTVYDDEKFARIEEICTCNAEVCRSLGQLAKMETWQLVATIVRNRRKHTGQGFDGWGGVGGGALAVGLLGNLLRYYESLGDVQMLSTLVCVLRSQQQTKSNGKGRDCFLLPEDQDAKYDLYIRRYADLLYGWGLLTIRAELSKHLVRAISSTEYDRTEFSDGFDEGQAYGGIAFVFRCPRCAGSSEFGYCLSCKEYAFRCVICDIAVRGLFTVCDICGHGGHVNHMKEWFASQSDECPAGCGCNCRLAAVLQSDYMPQGPSSIMVPPVQV